MKDPYRSTLSFNTKGPYSVPCAVTADLNRYLADQDRLDAYEDAYREAYDEKMDELKRTLTARLTFEGRGVCTIFVGQEKYDDSYLLDDEGKIDLENVVGYCQDCMDAIATKYAESVCNVEDDDQIDREPDYFDDINH